MSKAPGMPGVSGALSFLGLAFVDEVSKVAGEIGIHGLFLMIAAIIEEDRAMPLDRASRELHVTLTEMAFKNESAAIVLEVAALELPAGASNDVTDVIQMLRSDATTLRLLADRTQEGQM
ncbi:hypothetical protein [Pseudomonas aeruginosa]|uniref:hypothetical protein n=1 Tax=Pseudomonas aeruginosa TaxID=287 RepID=UPI00376F8F33